MKNLIVVLICFTICSCAPRINYLGNSYAPTQNVEIFFDDADIQKDYTVMGVVKNEGSGIELDTPEDVQKAMLKKAKTVGADAILFSGFYTERENGESTYINKEDKKQTTVDTYQDRTKIYEAKLIKYKN